MNSARRYVARAQRSLDCTGPFQRQSHERDQHLFRAGGLGSALTNPTELAYQKRAIRERYPLVFGRRQGPGVETAYLTLKGEDLAANDRLMAELIAAKFAQHPQLMAEVLDQGGREFLSKCSHFTGARTDRFRAWEGTGAASRFIRNLIAGFDLAQRGTTEGGQSSLV